ncbi:MULTISPECIES: hypothetical protein [unclassified Nonomuraea]|uniref:hypothetical protein n=1 Tax=unclassified Nonomuraea TaxID=2593643 RepID=UPI0033D76302
MKITPTYQDPPIFPGPTRPAAWTRWFTVPVYLVIYVMSRRITHAAFYLAWALIMIAILTNHR